MAVIETGVKGGQLLSESAVRVLADTIEQATLRNVFPAELLRQDAPEVSRSAVAYLVQRLYHAADLIAPMTWTPNAAELLGSDFVFRSSSNGPSQPGELRDLLRSCIARLSETVDDVGRSKEWLSQRGNQVFEAAKRASTEFNVAATFLLGPPPPEERRDLPRECALRALVLIERIAQQLDRKAA